MRCSSEYLKEKGCGAAEPGMRERKPRQGKKSSNRVKKRKVKEKGKKKEKKRTARVTTYASTERAVAS